MHVPRYGPQLGTPLKIVTLGGQLSHAPLGPTKTWCLSLGGTEKLKWLLWNFGVKNFSS